MALRDIIKKGVEIDERQHRCHDDMSRCYNRYGEFILSYTDASLVPLFT